MGTFRVPFNGLGTGDYYRKNGFFRNGKRPRLHKCTRTTPSFGFQFLAGFQDFNGVNNLQEGVGGVEGVGRCTFMITRLIG